MIEEAVSGTELGGLTSNTKKDTVELTNLPGFVFLSGREITLIVLKLHSNLPTKHTKRKLIMNIWTKSVTD